MSRKRALGDATALAHVIWALIVASLLMVGGILPASATGDPPVAVGDNYSTDENVVLSEPAPGILGNDTDLEGDPLTAVLMTSAENGTLTLNPDGSFTYTPGSGFSGTDSFTYVANDGTMDSNLATVTITVRAVGEPVALNDPYYATLVDRVLNVPAPGVLGNDFDPEGDPLTAVQVTPPSHGTLVLNANGSFTYTPAAGFAGQDTFTYQASDGTLLSNVATATITVVAASGDPVAVDDAYSTPAGQVLTVSAPGILGNDLDAENDPLTVTTVAPGPGTEGGTFDLAANGSFTYTPPADAACGTVDTFQYGISDGAGGTDTGQISVTITGGEAGSASITLTRSETLIEYGRKVTVTAQLSGVETTDGQVLSIFRTPVGGEKTLVKEGEVNDSGSLTASKNLYLHNTFVAEWGGVGCQAAVSSKPKKVEVKAKATGVLSGQYRVSGIYKLFHDNKDPFYEGTVKPNHAGQDLFFVLQNKPRAAWRLVFNQKFTMGADSSIGGGIAGLGQGTYRIRAVFKGDEDHARDESPWAFFKVTA
jgi:Bacterial Ig domain